MIKKSQMEHQEKYLNTKFKKYGWKSKTNLKKGFDINI